MLLVVRLPLLLHGLPLTQPELNWMLVGERLHRGFMVYTETWDSLSPLSAGVYGLIDLLFGRSQFAYQLFSLALVMFQSAYFSYRLQRHNLYEERTHLPAMLYCLCASLFFDFYTLSPVLMGLTFLLTALNGLFKQLSKDAADNDAFSVGFYIGLATLFYIAFVWFIAFAFVVLLLLSAVRLRKFLLLLFGFSLPVAVFLLSFYMINGYDAVYFNWIMVFWERYIRFYADLQTLSLISIPLALLLVLAASQMLGGNTRFVNFQIRCQQAVVMWLLAAAATLFFADDFAPHTFLVFVPAAAFFGTYYFLLVRKQWVSEVAFLVFLLVIFFNNFGRFYVSAAAPLWHDSRLLVRESESNPLLSQKRLLIIGQEMDEYEHNTPATPYLNWRLSRRHFENLDNYVTVIDLYDNFSQDLPEVIVDKKNVVPKLFKRIPVLASRYEKGNEPNVYVLKKTVAQTE